MKYYAIYNKETLELSKAQAKCLNQEVENIEISKEIYENLERYIYQHGEIVENPDYEELLLEQERLNQVEDIKQQLKDLDLQSIRAIRANETEYLDEYETQACTLRNQLAELTDEV